MPARAAEVCVKDVAGLKGALTSFELQPVGSTFTIKLVQGTYAVGNQLARLYGANADDVASLRLLGGYTTGCSSRVVNPANTVLDGLGTAASGMGFLMRGDSNALIEGVTFTRFKGKSNQAWGESEVLLITNDIHPSDSQVFEVRQCRFTHNSGQNVVRMSGAQMRFVNNLVSDSTLAQEASGIDLGAFTVTLDARIDGTVTATNNTIVRTTGGPAMRLGTLVTGSSGRISEVTDNILWNNQSWDIVFTGSTQYVYPLMASFNLYNSANSNFPQNPGDLHVDPRFVDAANENFRLASNSPAINSGALIQLMGFPARDLDGAARIVGSRIDLGAYESSIDDTTTAVVTTTSDNGNNTSPLAGSLRAAIKAGNAASVPFRIIFNVPGGCPRMLSLAAPMLDITGDVTIDGTTQSGWTPNDQYGQFNANLCFFVNGAGNASTPWALHVPASAPSSARLVVRGLGFAGFTDAAIKLEGGRNHRIAGNLFGPVPLTPANNNAIRVTGNSGGAFIGGYDDPSALNLIAVASGAGIYLDNAGGGSTVANNVIGFQADGTGSGGNASGIYVYNSPGNVVQYNAIGNNASHGVILAGSGSSGNLVQYNTIGLDLNGGAAGNGSGGVLVTFGAKNNTIGAPVGATWGGNFIYNNGGPGVWISASGGAGNRVLDNAFQGNVGLDIDLAQAGPSANQPANPATGPNNLQNHPVLASAVRDVASATETVTGTLTSTPDTTFRLDLYWGAACLPNGRGYARFPLMKTNLTTGALGSVSFTTSVAFGWTLPVGAISATVTDPAGNTSEIGNCVAETLSDRIFKNGFE
ncbi:MAG: right-handed parallel beta-helix repeat-containing protein [Rhodanobacteraceae bacterium]|jgi:hypothetical protein|nr:right-handed parallel beta-helix repeat-containing protein [Rhodanobacteraceae bacterium]